MSTVTVALSLATRLSALKMGDMVEIRSAGRFNMAALAQRFVATGLVRSAEQEGVFGGSRDIAALRQGAGWRLAYTVAWGDCPAGCIYSHAWSFLAFDTGGVRYVGSDGPAVPERPY